MQPGNTLTYDQARENLVTMYAHPKATFVVKGNKLESISRFNLIGRLIYSIKNRDGQETQKVKSLIQNTLTVLESGITEQNCAFIRPPRLFSFVDYAYEFRSPVSKAAEKVKTLNLLNKTESLAKAADTLIEKCKSVEAKVDNDPQLKARVFGTTARR